MRIGILGPLAATGTIAGARLRALLIVLALAPGQVVSLGRLIDGVWGAEPPAKAANALQVLVSRLRRSLPDIPVESHPAGYRLAIDPDEVDATQFERLVSEARSADDPTKARLLREALALWRGPALQDVADEEFFQPQVAHLTELRLTAIEDRVEADLRLGEDISSELNSLVAEHPVRERLVGALMQALSAVGKVNEALTVYERTRAQLADTLGADPSPELVKLHTAILQGVESPRTNLRAGLTSFVGRDEDATHVVKLVNEYRLTTLTGLGGAGKTRLSIEAGRRLLERSPDGVWLVELAPVTNGDDLAQAVLGTLGLRDQALMAHGSEPIDRLAAALSTRNAVLLLDNCEHVIDAAAALAERLLGDCPRLRILATSREPLGITGEALWPIEPLALPAQDATVEAAMRSAAVRMLSDRASAAHPGFAVTDGTVADVVRICRALDGIPLAIELAAARLRTMTTHQLANRLGDRFRLLTGGSRVALPRHQTLRAVVDWSWDLLSERERTVLRRLAVFSGGATIEAAERVCGGDAFEVLTALAEKSLLVAGDRYRMLETIKAYGQERLAEAGEQDRVQQAYIAYFTELVETADPQLRTADQLIWLERLNAERDNITAALRGAIAAGDTQAAIRLVAAAGWFWWLSGRQPEGAHLAIAALGMPGVIEDETQAVANMVGAMMAFAGQQDWVRTTEFFQAAQSFAGPTDNALLRLVEPLAMIVAGHKSTVEDDGWVGAASRLLRGSAMMSMGTGQFEVSEMEEELAAAVAGFEQVGERWGYASALTSYAHVLTWRGDTITALDHYERGVSIAEELGTSENMVENRVRMAQLRLLTGDPAGCEQAIAEAARDAERLGAPGAMALVEYGAAEIARWTGELDAARIKLAKAEELASGPGNPNWGVRTAVQSQWGYLTGIAGDLTAARTHHSRALNMALGSPNSIWIAHILVGVADLALRQGNPAEAARLLGASDTIRGAQDPAQPDVARVTAETRAALGEQKFADATREGRQATMTSLLEMAEPTFSQRSRLYSLRAQK